MLWRLLIFSSTLYWTTQHAAEWRFRETMAGPQEVIIFVLKKLIGYFWTKKEGRRKLLWLKHLCIERTWEENTVDFISETVLQNSSLKSEIFLCTSTSFVFNEEGTYAESTGISCKIPKEQYQRIWMYLKLSLESDLEHEIAPQWSNSENYFSNFLLVSWMMSLMPQISYCCPCKKIQVCV